MTRAMPAATPPRSFRHWQTLLVTLLVATLMTSWAVLVTTPAAVAADVVNLRVSIDEITEKGCDSSELSDYYAKVTVGSATTRFPSSDPGSYVDDDDHIAPVG